MLFPTQVKIMSNKFIFFVLVVNFLYIAIDNKYQDLLLYLNASSTTEDVKIYRIITELYEESNGIVVPAARKIRTFLLGIHALIVLIRLLTSSEKTVNIRFVVRSWNNRVQEKEKQNLKRRKSCSFEWQTMPLKSTKNVSWRISSWLLPKNFSPGKNILVLLVFVLFF